MTLEPRPYHSASSVVLGARCRRAWWYVYREGRRDPEYTFETLPADAPSRLRACALGKSVHARLESWYTGGRPSWADLPGAIAASLVGMLPAPGACVHVEAEHAIGSLPTGLALPRPPTALVVHGVKWGGFRDLYVELTAAEAKRLGMPVRVLVDYKTTSSIKRWAKTPDELRRDPAACLYALDVSKYGLGVVPCRWAYAETGRTRRALPVDFSVRTSDAFDVIAPLAELAQELDAMQVVEDAAQNSGACADYGGCPHHVSAGGPCNVARSIGARIAQQTRGKAMPLSEEQKAKFAKFSAKAAPVETADDVPAETADDAPVETADATPAKKPRKPRAKKAPPVNAASAEPEDPASLILGLHADLAAAVAAVAEAEAKRDALLTRIAEALSS